MALIVALGSIGVLLALGGWKLIRATIDPYATAPKVPWIVGEFLTDNEVRPDLNWLLPLPPRFTVILRTKECGQGAQPICAVQLFIEDGDNREPDANILTLERHLKSRGFTREFGDDEPTLLCTKDDLCATVSTLREYDPSADLGTKTSTPSDRLLVLDVGNL